MHLKEGLNMGQLEAVTVNSKHFMELADAGTEKSNSLLEKVNYHINDKQADANT